MGSSVRSRRNPEMQILDLEVAQGFRCGLGAGYRLTGHRVAVDILFEGPADDLFGAEANSEREREDDSAEEDSEGEIDDSSPDLKVVEDHGGRQHQDEPF